MKKIKDIALNEGHSVASDVALAVVLSVILFVVIRSGR